MSVEEGTTHQYLVVRTEDGKMVQHSDGGYLFQTMDGVLLSVPATDKTVRHLLVEEGTLVEPTGRNVNVTASMGPTSQSQPGQDQDIWKSRHPGDRDVEATKDFLTILQDPAIKSKFEDKKTKRVTIWKLLGERMVKLGYSLGMKPAEKIEAKFRNLESAYKKFIDNANTTGTGKMDPPMFYDELHAVFGDKQAVVIGNTISSMVPPSKKKCSQGTENKENDRSTTENDCYFDADEDNVPLSDVSSNSSSSSKGKAKKTTKPTVRANQMSQLVSVVKDTAEQQAARVKALIDLTNERAQIADERYAETTAMMERHHKDRQSSFKELINVLKNKKSRRRSSDSE